MNYLKILIFLFLTYSINAQNDISIEISNHRTEINTVGEKSIVIFYSLDLSKKGFKDYILLNDNFHEQNENLNPKLVSLKNDNEIVFNEVEIFSSITEFDLKFDIKNISDTLINQLINNLNDLQITIQEDINLEIIKGEDVSTLKKVKIFKSQINNYSKKIKYLTDDMAEELINSKGGEIFLTQNKFDFGIVPSDQAASGKTELNASFSYRTRYSFLKSDFPIYFNADGLISTNSRDSLNYISVYPINYKFFGGVNEFIGQIGFEGNQVFSNYRLSGDFFWNGIIPNIVNLTFGENRLRLKPVIKAGVKFYKELKNNRPVEINNNEFSNQVFVDYYYYIPIHKIYSLILEGSVFHDFNLSVNPDKKTMFYYSAVLGIDIPKTDFKTIFKYSKGENGITYEKNDYYMIGLMIDAFGLN